MLDIQVLQEVGSTNDLLRAKAISGSPEGTVLVAAMQTDGKGRMGRRFYSPADTGVYMSILLRPVSILSSKALRLTTMAAVAVCEAIESVSGKSALIKWVNDVYVDGKKVCGILTEGSVSLETGSLDYAILGVGINIYCPEKGFPAEIENIAGYIFDEKERYVRNKISASFLNNFFKYYLSGDLDSYIAEYRRRCFVIGKKIEVINGEKSRNAVAVDIDSSCQLIVRYEDGMSEHLSAGEISIRLQNKEN
jgi:BirA family biotin operon repressor/biotin-[acetyl-CoA-carboxylase] ligase